MTHKTPSSPPAAMPQRMGQGGRAVRLAAAVSICLLLPGTAALAGGLPSDGQAVASRPVDEGQIRNLVRVEGVIDGNLYDVGLRHDIPPAVMLEVVRMLGFGVDFERDIKPGDRFEVMYEQVHDANNQAVRSGDLQFAAITLGGRKLSVWRYTPKNGETEYFNAKGESLRTDLMRSPIDGARLSSPFGPRKHPILGYSRMHQGIDFAAPSGTPVYAAGDGIVEQAEPNGGYGNYVRIRHSETYQTAYAHLNEIARDLKPGEEVRQGQMIGTVGSTGLSTGPHLHYEVHLDDAPVDPDSVRLPPRTILDGPALAAFQWHSALLRIRPSVPPDPLLRQYSGDR